MFKLTTFILFSLCYLSSALFATTTKQSKNTIEDKFRQLEEILPTPNDYRNAAGEPGKDYWQQQVDYKIHVSLDENKRQISGKSTITYHNNSPYSLKYLWVQLEQNRFKEHSIAEVSSTILGNGRSGAHIHLHDHDHPSRISLKNLRRQHAQNDHLFGFEVSNIVDSHLKPLKHTIVDTHMRVDLPTPLAPGDTFVFHMDYLLNLVEENVIGARSGYEHFPDDARKGGNDIYLLSQWFPRLTAYSDYEAWHNKAFLGVGEFTLEFGNYDVTITVPEDHIVASTGVLQNTEQVLTKKQQRRLEKAKNAKRPVFVVTPKEALRNERSGTSKTKSWHFKAKNVRDFAWASSRKFIWDAKGYHQGGSDQPFVMAMSFYPKEGGELWEKYSTEAIIHTMEVYSRFTFDYPYPVSISVNGPVGGMEYPMITFNGPRTKWHENTNRTYSLSDKMYLIGVVIHEVGHNYFPMIVNSDERQWTWMDEGLNSFLDGLAKYEWDASLPWKRLPRNMIQYMTSENQVPIMTQSDSILQRGPNAYTKPAAALYILREVVLGRELFDFAFKEYALRWKNKRPTPSDFFRTMEEASGVDLDWFWYGWFYTTDHVDISLDKIYQLKLSNQDPDILYPHLRNEKQSEPEPLLIKRNKEENKKIWVNENPDVTDFHDKNDRFTVTNKERNAYNKMLSNLSSKEEETIKRALKENKNYYIMNFSNLGGLVMPILLEITFTDGKKKNIHIPAEIWRRDHNNISKLFVFDQDQVIKSVIIDPHWETADADINNNTFPRTFTKSRIEYFKIKPSKTKINRDLMKDSQTKLKEVKKKIKKK